MKSIRFTFAILMPAAALVCAAGIVMDAFPSPVRTVRIGINTSPAYSHILPDGTPEGFSVDVLNEAARRARMRIDWIVCPEGPDQALQSGKVSVWHILTDVPERHKWALFTDPWLKTRFVLVVNGNGAIRRGNDLAGRRLSHTDYPLNARVTRQFFPMSKLIPEKPRMELSSLCRGDADAVFIDMKQLTRSLLNRPPGCGPAGFELIPMEQASYVLSIGATQAGIRIARKLRAKITTMAEDRTLDRLHRKWLSDTADETRIVSELTLAQQRSQIFRYFALILAGGVILLGALMYRERLVRKRIKSAYEFASAVLDTAGGLVFICDGHGRIVRFNRACERATGLTFKEVAGKTSWDLFVPLSERKEVQSIFSQLAAGVPLSNHEHHWHTTAGERLFSWSNTILMNKAGRAEYIIATGIDISHREAAEQKLGYEAIHDPLTSLLNRRQFVRELEAAVADARSGSSFSVALADLDHFKTINDSYGHQSGDDVLVHLAGLLRQESGARDIAARLGGDEFALLIRNPAAEARDVEAIVGRIRLNLREHEFQSADGRNFRAAVTFGSAAWSEAMRTPADILRVADEDLYRHKRRRFESAINALQDELGAKMKTADEQSYVRTVSGNDARPDSDYPGA